MKTLQVNNPQQFIDTAQFACKVNHIDEVEEAINFEIEGEFITTPSERYAIEEMVVMSNDEFNDFKTSMMEQRELLEGKGGTSTTSEMKSAEGKNSFLELTEAEREEFQSGAYRKCIGITTQDGKNLLAVDPQGHNYARYIAIIK